MINVYDNIKNGVYELYNKLVRVIINEGFFCEW